MKRVASTGIIFMSAMMLGGCLSSGEGERAELAPRQTGVEGRWNAVGGPVAYTASFQGGSFSSTENATGASLAQGTYRDLGSGQITIASRSATSGQESNVNCSQMSADRLSCVTSGGTRFELARA
jgi:hypothetical protein